MAQFQAQIMTSLVHGDYVFAETKFSFVWKIIKPLLKENHLETGVYDMGFDPDFQRYLDMEAIGDLKFFVIYTDYVIVGYAMFFVDDVIYQKGIRVATQALNFVTQGHRGIGLAFMKFCDDILKRDGVNSIWRQATAKFDVGKIYERMGYEFVEKSYLRRL